MFVLCVAQVGPGLVLIPAVIWVYAKSGAAWGTGFLVWAIFCGTIDSVVRPWLIRRGADLPLLLIFAGVIGGLIAFGVIGLFIGPVVLAVAYTLLVDWVSEGNPDGPPPGAMREARSEGILHGMEIGERAEPPKTLLAVCHARIAWPARGQWRATSGCSHRPPALRVRMSPDASRPDPARPPHSAHRVGGVHRSVHPSRPGIDLRSSLRGLRRRAVGARDHTAGHRLRHVSELGIVLLLFIIGLEMHPEKLWSLRRVVFGLGSLQVLITGLAIAAYASLTIMPWKGALILGFGFALSSTAFAVQILEERGEMATEYGSTSFGHPAVSGSRHRSTIGVWCPCSPARSRRRSRYRSSFVWGG